MRKWIKRIAWLAVVGVVSFYGWGYYQMREYAASPITQCEGREAAKVLAAQKRCEIEHGSYYWNFTEYGGTCGYASGDGFHEFFSVHTLQCEEVTQ